MLRFTLNALGCVILLSLSAACQRKSEPATPTEETLKKEQPKSEEADTSSTEPKPQPTEPEQAKLVREPTSPDPEKSDFTLKEATEGLPKKGKLVADIETSMGTIHCTFEEKKAPQTVANFVGLARGLRPFWHAKEAVWVKRPAYDGTSFHRVIPQFMIQGGDYLGDGTGGVGYVIPDEIDPGLKHDKPGLLCMANRGPNTNGGQFFITHAAAPHLDGGYTIFGQCTPFEVIDAIAKVDQLGAAGNNQPVKKVEIKKVAISRGK